MNSRTRDYYEVMGLSKSASPKEIQRAFRKLAQKYHPDINKKSGSEERFKEICEAYEILKDPKKRKQYDMFGTRWQETGQSPFGFSGANHKSSFSFGHNTDFGIDDFFSSFFEESKKNHFARDVNSHFNRRRKNVHGNSLEAEINITLEEAFHGTTKNISLENTGSPGLRERGRKSIQVNIPRGMREGERVRLKGQGEPGSEGGNPGNLYLTVHILPHPVFKWDGDNLLVEVAATPWELALGARITVPTLDGPVRMNLAPGTQGGQKFRLQEKGFSKKNAQRNALTVKVKAAIPKKLSPTERKLFEELARQSQFRPRND